MNQTLQTFARNELKRGLNQLPTGWQRRFKQMYANGKLDRDIEDVVDAMPNDDLDWAMEQVDRSLQKLGIELEDA